MSAISNIIQHIEDFKIETFLEKAGWPSYKDVADTHPNINKVVILANHIFRLFPMIALAERLPFSKAKNCAILGIGSLFYRVTIERLCPLRFSLLSCYGAVAYIFAKSNDPSFLRSIPMGSYFFAVVYTSITAKACCNKRTVVTNDH